MPFMTRKDARNQLEESLNDLAAHMYRHGMHSKYDIQQMKKLLLERFDELAN